MRSYRSAIPRPRDCTAIAASFMVSRGGVLIAGLVAAIFIGYDPAPNRSALWRVAADPFHDLLARWDTFWYLDIAEHGYRWSGQPLEQQNVVFFPLLPALMRVLGLALGGRPLLAGLLVSLIAFAAALVYVWKWTAAREGDQAATAAVALLCAFPFAVFFSAVYTESLFLLAAAGAWYHAERRDPGRAALLGLAAGLTRPNGLLLAGPLAWLTMVADRRGRSWPSTGAIVLAPVVGAVLYSAYLALKFGDATAWMAGQAAWPSIAPWGGRGAPEPGPPFPFEQSAVVIHIGNAAALALGAISIRPVARRLGAAPALFIALNLLLPAARHGLQSLGRFTSVLFPIFVWLAVALPGRRRLLLLTFAIGQIVAATLFFTWRPLV